MTGNQFQVHYSEEDLFHIEGDYCRMYSNVVPVPECGFFVVRTQGIYEVATVNLGFDGNWDIYLRQIVTDGCEEGDMIFVYNRDRIYRCEKANNGIDFSFKRVSLLTLLQMIQDVEKRLQVKISDLAGHVPDLIQ